MVIHSSVRPPKVCVYGGGGVHTTATHAFQVFFFLRPKDDSRPRRTLGCFDRASVSVGQRDTYTHTYTHRQHFRGLNSQSLQFMFHATFLSLRTFHNHSSGKSRESKTISQQNNASCIQCIRSTWTLLGSPQCYARQMSGHFRSPVWHSFTIYSKAALIKLIPIYPVQSIF